MKVNKTILSYLIVALLVSCQTRKERKDTPDKLPKGVNVSIEKSRTDSNLILVTITNRTGYPIYLPEFLDTEQHLFFMIHDSKKDTTYNVSKYISHHIYQDKKVIDSTRIKTRFSKRRYFLGDSLASIIIKNTPAEYFIEHDLNAFKERIEVECSYILYLNKDEPYRTGYDISSFKEFDTSLLGKDIEGKYMIWFAYFPETIINHRYIGSWPLSYPSYLEKYKKVALPILSDTITIEE